MKRAVCYYRKLISFQIFRVSVSYKVLRNKNHLFSICIIFFNRRKSFSAQKLLSNIFIAFIQSFRCAVVGIRSRTTRSIKTLFCVSRTNTRCIFFARGSTENMLIKYEGFSCGLIAMYRAHLCASGIGGKNGCTRTFFDLCEYENMEVDLSNCC